MPATFSARYCLTSGRCLLNAIKDATSHRRTFSQLAGESRSSGANFASTTSISATAAAHRQRPPPISAQEFIARRDKLVDLIRADSQIPYARFLVCVPASTTIYMAPDVSYPFRQNSDFRYLCGLEEPDSLLILHSLSPTEYRSHIFVPEISPAARLWHGPGTDPAAAIAASGVDSLRFTSEIKNFMRETTESLHRKPFGLWYDTDSNWQTSGLKETSSPAAFPVLEDYILWRPENCTMTGKPSPFIQECRVIKSDQEVDLMRHAGIISAKAMETGMRRTEAGMTERELWSVLDHQSVMGGADRLAYLPVVASGSRATTIHYIKNSEGMQSGEMVLVDCGCEVDGYCSDLSRTWPVSSDYTPAQRVLYDIVHRVQTSILDSIRKLGSDYTNCPTLDDLYCQMLDLLAVELRKHRIMSGSISKAAYEERALVSKNFCPHHLGHYLGMDIHDCASVSRARKLERGMVFTVEPGLYIDQNNDQVPEEYRGNGIRIEDVVWLGPNGGEVLTKQCPSAAQDIIQLRRS